MCKTTPQGKGTREMIQRFTTKRDVIRAFANAMNLVSPEVQNHHEKVSYIAARLAETMGMNAQQRTLAFAGGLLHDIGGVLKQGSISLADIELNAGKIASAGAVLLQMHPNTSLFAPVVQASQTPWQRLKALHTSLKAPQLLGQIVHLADTVSLYLDGSQSALNQIEHVRECIHRAGDREFSPEVLAAFDTLCTHEAVWLDILYRPDCFLDMVTDDRWFTLDETVKLTEFMSGIIDFRSPFTAIHSAGVAASASMLAALAGMSEDEQKIMRIAGYLHDVGKLKTPNTILEKPGKLTDEEFNVMKEHAYFTWILLKDVGGFELITDWAAHHHEKLNGNGYPFHLPQSELSLGARIMAVADVFTALTEDRPYRKRMERDAVVSVLRGDAERGLLSGSIAELLIHNYDAINARRETESRAASKKYQESLAAG